MITPYVVFADRGLPPAQPDTLPNRTQTLLVESAGEIRALRRAAEPYAGEEKPVCIESSCRTPTSWVWRSLLRCRPLRRRTPRPHVDFAALHVVDGRGVVVSTRRSGSPTMRRCGRGSRGYPRWSSRSTNTRGSWRATARRSRRATVGSAPTSLAYMACRYGIVSAAPCFRTSPGSRCP